MSFFVSSVLWLVSCFCFGGQYSPFLGRVRQVGMALWSHVCVVIVPDPNSPLPQTPHPWPDMLIMWWVLHCCHVIPSGWALGLYADEAYLFCLPRAARNKRYIWNMAAPQCRWSHKKTRNQICFSVSGDLCSCVLACRRETNPGNVTLLCGRLVCVTKLCRRTNRLIRPSGLRKLNTLQTIGPILTTAFQRRHGKKSPMTKCGTRTYRQHFLCTNKVSPWIITKPKFRWWWNATRSTNRC